MSAPLVVNTRDGMCWTRRTVTSSGIALYAPEKVQTSPEFVMATLPELAEHGIVGSADVLPVPVGSPSEGSSSYPPAMPWARLMDAEDLADFLDELAASAITHASNVTALAEVEKTCATWRLIAEAQHAHNTAPGPDAMTRRFAPTQALQLEDPHDSPLHHTYLKGRDLPETGGAR